MTDLKLPPVSESVTNEDNTSRNQTITNTNTDNSVLPDVKSKRNAARSKRDSLKKKEEEVDPEELRIARLDSDLRAAMTKRKKEDVPTDFFKLNKNKLFEYNKSEYYINSYFQRYFSEKIQNYHFAGMRPSPDLQNQEISTADPHQQSIESKIPVAHRLADGPADPMFKDNNVDTVRMTADGKEGIEAFMALQKVQTKNDLAIGSNILKQMVYKGQVDYKDAVSVQRSGRTTLYSTIVDNSERMDAVNRLAISPSKETDVRMSLAASLQGSSEKKDYKSVNPHRRPSRITKWNNQGKIDSNQHLMKFVNQSNFNDGAASEVYLSSRQRKSILQSVAAKQESNAFKLPALETIHEPKKKKKTKRNQIDNLTSSVSVTGSKVTSVVERGSIDNSSVKRSQKQNRYKSIKFDNDTIFQGSQSMAPVIRKSGKIVTGIPSYEYKERRQSFNMCQTKFEDVKKMLHPLKSMNDTLADKETIQRAKNAKRFPVPESILHKPYDFELTIDSLIHEAYNPPEPIEIDKTSLDAPCNSMESVEQIEFYSSEDDEVKIDPAQIDTKQRIKDLQLRPVLEILSKQPQTRDELLQETKMKMLKVHKGAYNLHGFDMNNLKTFPFGVENGDVPSYLLAIDNPNDLDRAPAMIDKTINQYVDDPQGKNKEEQTVRLQEIFYVHKQIQSEFENQILLPTMDHLRFIYKRFCTQFNATPLNFLGNWQNDELKLEKYHLNMAQAKSIACMIPVIKNLKTLVFNDNCMSDHMCSLMILAAYMNPSIQKVAINGQSNKPKLCTFNTLRALFTIFPKKITDLSFSGVQDIGVCMARTLTEIARPGILLRKLDLSQQKLSPTLAQAVGQLLIMSKELRELNLQACHLAGYSTSIIFDGLCRNVGLQNFNFSHNSMASSHYENAIKMTSTITRHRSLLHLDLSMTGLSKEEVIFIGMSLNQNSTLQAIHLSGNGIEYYERIFLRTLIDAKCAAQFRKLANSRRSKMYRPVDKNKIFHSGVKKDNFEDELDHFLNAFAHVESLRQTAHDEALEKLVGVKAVQEEEDKPAIDVVELFEDIRAAKGKKVTQEKVNKANEARLQLQNLITKLQTASEMAIQEGKELSRIVTDRIKLSQDTILLADLAKIGIKKDKEDPPMNQLENLPIVKEAVQKPIESIETKEDNSERYELANMLKIDRIRQRVQFDALKHLKSKSAAEIAIMFQGIGRIALDVLHENPMVSYMNECVFTRTLGNDDIEDGEVWKDTSECWICQKWNKQRVLYKPEFINNMKQDMQKMHELDTVLQKVLDEQNHIHLEPADNYIESENDESPDGRSLRTATEDRIETESDVGSQMSGGSGLQALEVKEQFQNLREMGQTDGISAVPFDKETAAKQLPQNYRLVREMGRPEESSMSEDSSEEEFNQKPRKNFGFNQKAISVLSDSEEQSSEQDSYDPDTPPQITRDTFPINKKMTGNEARARRSTRMHLKVKPGGSVIPEEGEDGVKRKPNSRFFKDDGRMYRTVTKEFTYFGYSYLYDEDQRVPTSEEDNETSIDSGGTSGDEFEVTNQVSKQFKNKIQGKLLTRSKVELEKSKKLKKLLDANCPKTKSIFGRKQVFICASFNDWVPQEMKSIHELRLQIAKGDKLEAYIEDCKMAKGQGLKSGKDVLNIVQYANYIPPGKHFFYFIQDGKHMCLSSDFPVVRYSGTNVFLNKVEIKQRDKLPPLAQQTKKVARGGMGHDDGIFRKERSIFKTFQEDDEDFVQKMFKADQKYAKITRFLERNGSEDSRVLEIFEEHYKVLKNMFMYYVANSKNYPRMNVQDFKQFCFKRDLFDRNYKVIDLDKLFTQTNASITQFKNSEDRELNRYEFFEILIRIAKMKYQDPKIHPVLDDALYALINKDLVPGCKLAEGELFRQQHVYAIKVDEYLTKNQGILKRLYEFTVEWTSKQEEKPIPKNLVKLLKDTVSGASMQSIRDLVTLACINIKPQKVNLCFVESLMSKQDPMIDGPINANRMRFPEFLCFICRVAHELYVGTAEEHKMELHQKLDEVAPLLLKCQGLEPSFSFKNKIGDEDEEVDAEMGTSTFE